MSGGPGSHPALIASLARQRGRDVLGPDGLEHLIAHSLGFDVALGGADRPTGTVVDLGSGGGVPGLVLAAAAWPEAHVVLVDASQRRCTYLELEVAALGLGDRVDVRWGRAEEVGRDPRTRGAADVVTSRSFGPPAVAAECAAPLLRLGGVLLVSEPPGSVGERWPSAGLARAGLVLEALVEDAGSTYARLRQTDPCPDTFPRRPGIPSVVRSSESTGQRDDVQRRLGPSGASPPDPHQRHPGASV